MSPPAPKVGFVSDERFLLHVAPAGHPERPERLAVITSHLRACGLWGELCHFPASPAAETAVALVHVEEHLAALRHACAAGGGLLDGGDTYAVRDSYGIALLAAGAVLAAVDKVVSSEVPSAFCAVRPPGHHAERDCPMGFCLLNNVAIGARYAQQSHGIKKIAILDWDVHHGNGTQHIFYDDPTVLYISLHQYPFYPGTGSRQERGAGKGEGFTLNFPLPAGTGEDTYLKIFNEDILPALGRFRPGLLLLSAGFDAHRDDPLAGMMLTSESFGMLTSLLRGVAPIVSVLEGGYDLHALATSVESHLRALQ